LFNKKEIIISTPFYTLSCTQFLIFVLHKKKLTIPHAIQQNANQNHSSICSIAYFVFFLYEIC
jgi:hypothetical protein